MKEQWKDIPGFEGRYQVSDAGRVRSVDRVAVFPAYVTKSGTLRAASVRAFKGKVLRPGPMASGHLSVALGRGNSRQVHQLVLLAFVGPCPDGHEVLHRDGVSSNNHRRNLRYGTRAENLRDDVHHGKRLVTVSQIRRIRSTYRSLPHGGKAALARELGISASHAGNIASGREYKGGL